MDPSMLLKILILRITINSRSMVTYIRSMLSELDKHRVITKFNEFMQLDALVEIGKSFSDIMDNLLKGYCWNILENKKEFLQYRNFFRNFYGDTSTKSCQVKQCHTDGHINAATALSLLEYLETV